MANYLLQELHSGKRARQQLALLRLKSVVFPDDEMAATLAGLDSHDLELRDAHVDVRRVYAAPQGL